MKVFGIWGITEQGKPSFKKVKAMTFAAAISECTQEDWTIYKIELFGIEVRGVYYSLTFKEQ